MELPAADTVPQFPYSEGIAAPLRLPVFVHHRIGEK
jgi:hypothetical protein